MCVSDNRQDFRLRSLKQYNFIHISDFYFNAIDYKKRAHGKKVMLGLAIKKVVWPPIKLISPADLGPK